MDFLNHRERNIFYQVFLIFSFALYSIETGETIRGCVSLTHGIWQTVIVIYGSAEEILVPAHGDALAYSMRNRYGLRMLKSVIGFE
jgi:hypothetical protein